MNPPEPFVDIHCHLLPGIDDGAASENDALAMADMAVADGIDTIVATPHQLGNFAENSAEMIRGATAKFQERLVERKLPLRVLPGADVRIEPDLTGRIRRGEVLTLADHGRHVLLELPHNVYVPLERLLAEMSSAGLVGILSHPERNQGILRQPGVLRPLVDRGCLLQVTAGSLLGTFGSEIKTFSESLIAQGLVHFLATDAHGIGRRRPLLSPAFERVAQLSDVETAIDLCCRNPGSVALGRPVTPGCRKTLKSARTGWFRRAFSSGCRPTQPIH